MQTRVGVLPNCLCLGEGKKSNDQKVSLCGKLTCQDEVKARGHNPCWSSPSTWQRVPHPMLQQKHEPVRTFAAGPAKLRAPAESGGAKVRTCGPVPNYTMQQVSHGRFIGRGAEAASQRGWR